jgi:hypothetical protein
MLGSLWTKLPEARLMFYVGLSKQETGGHGIRKVKKIFMEQVISFVTTVRSF